MEKKVFIVKVIHLRLFIQCFHVKYIVQKIGSSRGGGEEKPAEIVLYVKLVAMVIQTTSCGSSVFLKKG